MANNNAITRKVTVGDKYRHYLTTIIKGCQVLTDGHPDSAGKAYILFSDQYNMLEDQRNLSPTETRRRISPEAYKRATRGCPQAYSRKLRNKLVGQPRFNFVVVAEKDPNNPDPKNDVVCNFHSYPNSNFRGADMEQELRRPLSPETAVVQFHPWGDIDIVVFPDQFAFGLKEFLDELEKLESIDSNTSIVFTGPDGKVRAVVENINNTTVDFACVQE